MVLLALLAHAALAEPLPYRAAIDVQDVAATGSTWRVRGIIDDSSAAGFDGLGVRTNYILACESSFGDIDLYVIQSIATQTVSWLDCIVSYSGTGTAARVGSPTYGQGMISYNASSDAIPLTQYSGPRGPSLYLKDGLAAMAIKRLAARVSAVSTGGVGSLDLSDYNNDVPFLTNAAAFDVAGSAAGVSNALAPGAAAGATASQPGHTHTGVYSPTNHTHTGTYQPADSDLDDLADGLLTGSKVGTGINAANITTGTLPTDRIAIGSISGSKLVITNTVTSGYIVRVSVVGGHTNLYVTSHGLTNTIDTGWSGASDSNATVLASTQWVQDMINGGGLSAGANSTTNSQLFYASVSNAFTVTANTTTTINWNKEVWDFNNGHSNISNPNRWYPTTAGYYAFSVFLRISTSPLAARHMLLIRVDGSLTTGPQFDMWSHASASGWETWNFGGMVYIGAGSYLDVGWQHTGLSGNETAETPCRLFVWKVSR